ILIVHEKGSRMLTFPKDDVKKGESGWRCAVRNIREKLVIPSNVLPHSKPSTTLIENFKLKEYNGIITLFVVQVQSTAGYAISPKAKEEFKSLKWRTISDKNLLHSGRLHKLVRPFIR
ncbi:unnamed protein product, partial [Rotaria sordida]